MSELDEAWAFALADAEARARMEGRGDIARYLALRKSNDLLRKIGIEWLISTFETLAGEANRRGSSIRISKGDGHRFQVGNSTMVGSLLALSVRVRTLSVEAGWPRAPEDGFIRGGGLACANIRHLGIKAASNELLLVQSPQGSPRWMIKTKQGRSVEFHEADLRKHIAILIAHD
ncbi:MAG: hypothetical protein ACRD8U_19610 [Pyrinomonadaceae bacterium]